MRSDDTRYSIAVVATMSAGKSSLLNALMGTELLPSQNEACTATVFKIEDYDELNYFNGRYRTASGWSEWNNYVTRETLQSWNHEAPKEIELHGNLPNIANTPSGVRVCFIDTPGPNNSMCDAHEKITEQVIAENDFSTLIFVINSGVAGVRDEWTLLNKLKKQCENIDKKTQILFALNKIDLLDVEKGESVLEQVKTTCKYLEEQLGFHHPMVVPVCSRLSSDIRLAMRSAKRLTVLQYSKLTGQKVKGSIFLPTKGKQGKRGKLRKTRSYICLLSQRNQMELASLLELFQTFSSEYKNALENCEQLHDAIEEYNNGKFLTPTRKIYIHDRFYSYKDLYLLDALSGVPYLEKYIEDKIFSIAPSEQINSNDSNNIQDTEDEADEQNDDDNEEVASDSDLMPQEVEKTDVILSDKEIESLPKSQTSDMEGAKIFQHIEFSTESIGDVKIACSANNWRTVTMSRKEDNGNMFFVNLYLPAGTHFFKYLVNGRWTYDHSHDFVPDNNGDFANKIVIQQPNGETKMLNVGIVYNPYLVTTELTLDNEPVPVNSTLHVMTQDRIQNWIDKFFDVLYEERREKKMLVQFTGTEWDAEDVISAAQDYTVKNPEFDIQISTNISKINDEMRLKKLQNLFEEGKHGPFAELFNSEEMKNAFERATDPHFEVNVIATMSSGKSTVINSLIGQELMPAKNEACTATIARIEDDDNMTEFLAQRFDKDGNPLSEIVPATRETLTEWNDDEKTHCIEVRGNIPTVNQTSSCTYVFVDTPGPNNARNAAHEQATLEAIQSKPLSMVLYVLNSTQLSTRDDDSLLKLVCKEMEKGGRKAHDRFVFVANKIDAFDPEKGESVTRAMENVRQYLHDHGLMNPIIIPASAQLAKMLRLPKESLTRKERGDLNAQIELFTEEPEMNMIEHSKKRLSANCARHLEERLREAKNSNDERKIAELLSGIPIVEELLNDFLQKHALPAKLKDTVDTFNQVMQQSVVAGAMNEQLAKSEEELKKIVDSVKHFTDDQASIQKAQNFRAKVKSMHYALSKNAEDTCEELMNESERLIEDMTNDFSEEKATEREANRLVEDALKRCQSLEAEVTVALNDSLKKEYFDVIGKLRDEYQEYVASIINENFPENESMRTLQKASMSMPSVTEMVMDYTQTVQVKTGTKKVKVGTEQVKIGTEQVKVGTKQVEAGSHEEVVGRRELYHYEKQYKTERYGFLWLKKREVCIGEERVHDGWEDIKQLVKDYKTEDVYETRDKYETRDVLEDRDVMEDRRVVNLKAIHRTVAKTIRKFSLDNIERFKENAQDNVEHAKETLLNLMDVIDDRVKEISNQLANANANKAEKERLVAENKKKVEWFNAFKQKVDNILAI
ncbi:MAG: dynamin family protein [Victivallales bacterium]|nr:dynamin family protein [Victivallales bacterium]